VLVETGWGRIGTKSRVLVRSFAEDRQAMRYVQALLARRRRARRRLGVDYALTSPLIRYSG
jgi:predicted DNA-binding WGR domain protein